MLYKVHALLTKEGFDIKIIKLKIIEVTSNTYLVKEPIGNSEMEKTIKKSDMNTLKTNDRNYYDYMEYYTYTKKDVLDQEVVRVKDFITEKFNKQDSKKPISSEMGFLQVLVI